MTQVDARSGVGKRLLLISLLVVVICELIICRCADDVRAAVLQSLLFPHDRQDISGTDDNRSDIHNDFDFEYGDLHTALAGYGFISRPHQEVHPIRPALISAL